MPDLKLLETIRLNNGEFCNLSFHQERMNKARFEIFGQTTRINLEKLLSEGKVQEIPAKGLFKCRIIYRDNIESIEFLHYTMPTLRTLRLVVSDAIEYPYKYLDRTSLETLFQKREQCDDILIVKEGLFTDSSAANILFFNGRQWITPAKPLLAGTQRAKLLEEERISTADIRPSDLRFFSKVRLINAMIRFEDEIEIEASSIFL